MLSDRDRKVIDQMQTYGGGFCHALAKCFLLADEANLAKLRAAFADYWNEYSRTVDGLTLEHYSPKAQARALDKLRLDIEAEEAGDGERFESDFDGH